MTKQKTSKARLWKVATFLPLLALLLMAFSKTGESSSKKELQIENAIIQESTLEKDSKIAKPEVTAISSEKSIIQNNKKKQSENNTQEKEQSKQTAKKTVRGKVVDAKENPLEGASVVVSGKSIGTVTDNEGNFILNPTDLSPIVISYIGFTSVKIEPDFENQMTIRMNPENIGIDEIVVVSYGIPKQSTEITTNNTSNNGSTTTNDEVFVVVEQMPQFPGGPIALRKYIASQIMYPVSAQKNNIQGKVFVTFVINSDGRASNVTIAKSVNPALDNEAIRVVYSLPKWTPGYQHGKAVDVAYTIPIEFQIEPHP